MAAISATKRTEAVRRIVRNSAPFRIPNHRRQLQKCRIKTALHKTKFIVVKLFLAMVLMLTLTASPAMAANTSITVKGLHNERLTVKSNVLKAGSEVNVTGSYFDESVGIYLAYCVMPDTGKLPSPCGGGVNKSGIGDASYWISSNPPPYGKGLAIPFKPGGRFNQKLLISRFIGKVDCKKVKCAITVRADHMMAQDRSYDLFIPVKLK